MSGTLQVSVDMIRKSPADGFHSAQVPLSRKRAGITLPVKKLWKGGLTLQVVNGSRPVMALPDPVLDTVLGGHFAGEDRRSCG